jgi:hypothetical protein
MKFTAAVLALAVGAMAHNKSFETESEAATSTSTGSFIDNKPTPSVVYTTEVVTAITTYCPGPTTLTHGSSTYTVTEATTLTISDCPCTIKKPVTVISSVVCSSGCPSSASTVAPSFQTTYSHAPSSSVGTVTRATSAPSSTKTSPPIQTAGAGKAAALSGGALAGVLGFAALVL